MPPRGPKTATVATRTRVLAAKRVYPPANKPLNHQAPLIKKNPTPNLGYWDFKNFKKNAIANFKKDWKMYALFGLVLAAVGVYLTVPMLAIMLLGVAASFSIYLLPNSESSNKSLPTRVKGWLVSNRGLLIATVLVAIACLVLTVFSPPAGITTLINILELSMGDLIGYSLLTAAFTFVGGALTKLFSSEPSKNATGVKAFFHRHAPLILAAIGLAVMIALIYINPPGILGYVIYLYGTVMPQLAPTGLTGIIVGIMSKTAMEAAAIFAAVTFGATLVAGTVINGLCWLGDKIVDAISNCFGKGKGTQVIPATKTMYPQNIPNSSASQALGSAKPARLKIPVTTVSPSSGSDQEETFQRSRPVLSKFTTSRTNLGPEAVDDAANDSNHTTDDETNQSPNSLP